MYLFISIESHDVAQPFLNIINILFVREQLRFDIIVYGQKGKFTNKIIHGIMSQSDEKFATEVRFIDPSKWSHIMNKSAVILMSNSKYFEQFNKLVTLNSTFYNPLRFIIYCEYLTHANLLTIPKEEILTMESGHISLYEYILLDDINGYFLQTFEWYTSEICNSPTLFLIDYYDKLNNKWIFGLNISRKFRNFHGCMLTIGLSGVFNHDIQLPLQPIELFNGMAKKGNFESHIQLMQLIKGEDGTLIEVIPSNGFVTDKFQTIFMIVRLPYIKNYDMKHLTTPFIEDRISFALAKPESFNSFEKMILPFDLLTWIFTIVVFITAFGCISIINLFSKQTQKLFYGENVKSPALNVLGIFFGFSQTHLPVKNFPRMLLVTFVMFCLVLRTAYQGVLFTMMSTDMGKILPKSIEDLYDMNYTIVINEDDDYFKEMIPEKLWYINLCKESLG